MNIQSKNQNGFGVVFLVLLLGIFVLIGFSGLFIVKHKSYPTISDASGKQTIDSTNKHPLNTDEETLDGLAYQSPNEGEGISIRYTQTIDGQIYHPFLPLQHAIDENTKITNSKNQTIPLAKIKVNDHLIVNKSRTVCAAAMVGSTGGGCQFNIHTIKDLSL